MPLVERIQYLCTQNGIKIKPLEETLGIANGSIKKWNNSSPSCERILKVAQYFHVSVDWLLTGKFAENDIYAIFSNEECELINKFRKLSEPEKQELLEILELKLRKEKAGETLSPSKEDEKPA